MKDERPDSFAGLLRQAQEGNASAQGRLLGEDRSWLKRVARRCLPAWLTRQTDASDLVQDCCQQATGGLGRFQGSDRRTFRAWLRGILQNLVRRLVRKEYRRHVRECLLPAGSAGDSKLQAEQTPVVERVLYNLDVAWLYRALTELEDQDRRLLELRFLHDQPYEAVASALGLEASPEELARLRQRVHRLLERLRTGIPRLPATDSWPPHLRRVWCLRHFKGWSTSQIAQALECGEGAVRRWLTEAERRLPSPELNP